MFDCVMINNELDLLELRMQMLYDVVDKFVIIESNTTHAGKPKPTYVTESLKIRFAPFHRKMILRVIPGELINSPKDSSFAWGNENRQRNEIINIEQRPADGLFCVCDVDEIPDPQKLLDARALAIESRMPVALEMHACSYFMNYKLVDTVWRGPFVYSPERAKQVHDSFHCDDYSPTGFRWHMSTPGYEQDFPRIENAGWHFSTMGTIEQIRKKIQDTAHIEYNTDQYTSEEYLKQCISEGKWFTNETNNSLVRMPISFLPEYVQNNIDKYKKYVL